MLEALVVCSTLLSFFFSRKQKRVTRSTFEAELHNTSECLEMGMLLAGCLHELIHGACSSASLAKNDEAGAFESVYQAIKASEIKVPTEANLLYPFKAIREHMDAQRINRSYWIDTRDMLCDGLTKGSIYRKPLLQSFATGAWRLECELKCWSAPVPQVVKPVA
eukprot:1150295-Heterocapsa_arctica.AAC.1